jgi:uncharacterized repeat protein (TIGR02543 family)
MSPTTYTIETPTITLPTPTKTGYTFAGWFDNSGLTGTAITSIPIGNTGNKEYWAKWTAISYTIIYHSNGGGSVPDSTYTIETPTITLPTLTWTGNNWIGWYDNSGLTGTAVTSIPQGSTGNKEFWGKWESINFTITASAGTNGVISPTGAVSVPYGTNQIFSFSPNSGYEIDVLTVDNEIVSNTSGNYTFTNITSNHTIDVTFKVIPANKFFLSLQINPTQGGTVEGGGTYDSAQVVQISATANSGWHFVNWIENGNIVSTSSNMSVTMNDNRTLIANFEENPLPKYQITATALPVNAGTITGAGQYDSGTVATLIATPSSNYKFVAWFRGNSQVSTNNTYSFTVIQDAEYTANFEEIAVEIPRYKITGAANPSNAGNVQVSETFVDSGKTCTVTTVANTGYNFINWTESDNVISTENPYTFVVTNDRTLIANFAINTYTISFDANGGSDVPSQKVNHNSTVTEPSEPTKSGYTFSGWYKEANYINLWNFATDKVVSNITLYAKWSPISVTSVQLTQKTLELLVGSESVLLQYTILPANAINKSVSWLSTHPSVASVNNGEVSPLTVGETDIIVTTQDGSFSDTCHVIVKTIGIIDKAENKLNLYPNPADDYILISGNDIEIQRIEFVNAAGQIFMLTAISDKIDISNLPNGAYSVYIYHSAGRDIHRVMKMK